MSTLSYRELTHKSAAQRVRTVPVINEEIALTDGVFSTLPPGAIPTDGWIFAEYSPLGVGPEDGIHIVDIALIDALPSVTGATQFRQRRLATLTCRSGAMLGTNGGFIQPGERLCDNVTVAEHGLAFAIALKFGLRDADGAPQLVYPANPHTNGYASVIIGEFCRADYLRFAFRGFTAGATGANGLIQFHA